MFTHLKLLKADIVFLQETHLRSSEHSKFLSGWAGQCFHSTFQAKARGVAILVSKDVLFEPTQISADRNGRFVIVSGKLFDTNIVLANIYAPNVDDVAFFELVFSKLPELDSQFLVLGGDFNCWLDPELDRSSTKSATRSKSASYIQSFLSECGISDIWRSLHPTDRTYSFFSHVHHTYTRIDHLFVDDRIAPQVGSCDYQSIVISDHAPLVMSMTFSGIPKPTRHWRFNSTLLSNEKFVKFMEGQISLFLDINNTPDVSALTVWDALKAYMRGQII